MNGHRRIETYEQAFVELLGLPYTQEAREMMGTLEADGHTQKSVCYAMWRTKDTLIDSRNNPSFQKILLREIRRYSWDKNDPRWQDYNKRKSSSIE